METKNHIQKKTQSSFVELWKASYNLPITPQTTIEQVREMNTPSISAMSKFGSKESVMMFIMESFILLIDYFGTTWSDSQIKISAEDFYDSFYHWKVADIKKFTQSCRTLQFGKPYGAFSPSILIQWALDYNSQWLEVSEKLALSKHGETKDRCQKEETPILKLLKNKL